MWGFVVARMKQVTIKDIDYNDCCCCQRNVNIKNIWHFFLCMQDDVKGRTLNLY